MNHVYEKIVSRIMEELEQGVLPWKQSWRNRKSARGFLTNHVYTGINRIATNMQDYGCPYWVTYKQVSKLGGTVNRGEKATPLLWFKVVEDKKESEKKYAVAKSYNVFNLEQTTLEIPKEEEPQLDFHPIEKAEQIIDGYKDKPRIKFGGDVACYNSVLDEIRMPMKSVFDSVESYYDVLFHELTHSTGHSSRLNREGIVNVLERNKEDYSYEELIAQIGSSFLCTESGIDSIEESASYINGWVKYLKKNGARTLVTAVSEAERAVGWILNKTSNLR